MNIGDAFQHVTASQLLGDRDGVHPVHRGGRTPPLSGGLGTRLRTTGR